MSPIIRVEDLVKVFDVHIKAAGFKASFRSFFRRQYREVRAVDGIGFAIAPGEIVGFLGPNGAGKTTTLKLLAGLLHPTSGRIEVLGYEPKRRDYAYLRAIALVMGQRRQLAWDLSAADSFLVNKAIYDIDDADYRRRLGDLADMLDLGPLLDKPVRKLSLGERMKCELAGALLHAPSVLFLDEPTIGLDLQAQQAVRRFIADYNRHSGATILLTSHYMADVEALARRVIIIDEGRLVHDGDLAALVAARAPEKFLRLHFGEPVEAERLAAFPGLRATEDGGGAEIAVPRHRVAEIATQLLASLPIADIAIEDMPLETVIGELFGRRKASPPA